MDVAGAKKKVRKLCAKYKYVCLVIVVGMILLLFPAKQGESATGGGGSIIESQKETVDIQLARILNQVEGAGAVEVLLTTISDAEVIYQEDYKTSTENADTVIITDANRNQNGLIRKTLSPIYRGAVVVCEGADRPDVCLMIVEAVKNATGLRSDQISVLKMK